MFFIDYESFYGKKSPNISGKSPVSTRNISEGSTPENIVESDDTEVKAHKDSQLFSGLKSKAMKVGGDALSKASNAAKGAVDYARSDEAAEKMNAAKDKLGSGLSSAGDKLSGFGSRASGFISAKKDALSKSYISEQADIEAPESDAYYPENNRENDAPDVRYNEPEQVSQPAPVYQNVPQEKSSKPIYYDSPIPENKPSNVNKILIAIIAVLVVGMSFMGGMLVMKNKDSNDEKIPESNSSTPSSENIDETVAATEESTVAQPTESKTEKPTQEAETADNSWQSLYAEQLKNFKNSSDYNDADGMASKYDLFDINDDKIPELFISTGEFHSAECRVYSVANSECVNIFNDSMAYGVIKVVPEKNYIIHYDGHMGNNSMVVREHRGLEIRIIDKLSDNIANADYEPLKCTQDDKEIDVDEYVKIYNRYAKLDAYTLGQQFDFSDISADSLVKNYNSSNPAQNTVAAKIEAPKAAPDEPLPSISAYIETYPEMQGYSSYLFVSGDFEYVKVAECYESGKSEYKTYYKNEFTPSVYLLGYSAFGPDRPYIEIIPYNSSDKAGNAVTCQLPDDPAHSAPISDKFGLINVHGGAVSGVDASYVLNNQPYATVRDRLGDGWHIVAKNICSNHGVTWYECWDSQDDDYYGWVDSSFIDFY